MTPNAIRDEIKKAVSKVTKIDARKIGDHESFRDDLGLDSLSFLETLVEVQYRFNIPDANERDYEAIVTIDHAVEFVQRHLCVEVAS